MDLGLLLGGIAQGGGDNIGFHTGVITSWDELTGVNTVSVGGTDMANLSVLSPSTTIGLRAGMTVGVLRVRTKYFILGRIAAPGAGAALSVRRASEPLIVETMSSSWVDLGGPTISNVYIGDSRAALVFLSVGVISRNQYSLASFEVTGASSISPDALDAATGTGAFDISGNQNVHIVNYTSSVYLVDEQLGLNTGFNTFSMRYQRATADGFSSSQPAQFEARRLVVMPL
ncbi:hypothetical protein [Saccharomonospora cyanea]|uniref:Uncharacterized protein n=1 Tax=Saccharomonospora cyanea NA-134 TaxID=882082 RepID=H5XG44_9PSEU|nr:hypothetical protein [Saccharomonospora cyanea]EHR62626.1 hypothetical protein SaccyDRAFT_3799 [Saccharomonospora cyanea NA-134]